MSELVDEPGPGLLGPGVRLPLRAPRGGAGAGGRGPAHALLQEPGTGDTKLQQALGLKFRAGSLLQQRQRGCSENLTSCLVQLLYWMQGFGVELSHKTETFFSKNL